MISGCPFCHHQDSRIHRENQITRDGNYRDISLCNECGLLYPNHRMDLNEIQEYLNNIYTNQADFSFGDLIGASSGEIDIGNLLLAGRVRRGGDELDIGTYDGRFCHTLNLLGFQAYGLEPQQEAVKHARQYGINIYQGSFPDDMPNELIHIPFDLISLMECIYYLGDLKHSLQIINKMLSEDGCILIKCHQGYSRYYDDNSYFSRYGDHVQGIPSFSSLRKCLKKTGFKIVKVMGQCPADLWPPLLRLPSAPLLRGVIARLYPLFMLNWTLLGILRPDRLIILAKKIQCT